MKCFEELPVWKDARRLTQRVYAAGRQGPLRSDHGFRDQIQRAAVSIVSNIAEGHERGTTPDVIQFLFYAKGSAGEVRAQLYVAEDLGYMSPTLAADLRAAAADISRALAAWVRSMQAPDFRRGPQHRQGPSKAQTRWEQLIRDNGLTRLPNGSFVQKPRE